MDFYCDFFRRKKNESDKWIFVYCDFFRKQNGSQTSGFLFIMIFLRKQISHFSLNQAGI